MNNMQEFFPDKVEAFIRTAHRFRLKMIMVGGGAVNFHGYQRHSADLDFWIDIRNENIEKLLQVLQNLGYPIENFPIQVLNGEQNISIKISPVFDLELTTKFNPGKSFDQAYNDSQVVKFEGIEYRVLNLEDLIKSKISSDRIKDKLDVEELHKIQIRKKED